METHGRDFQFFVRSSTFLALGLLKDLSAIGGKIGGSGAGVEAEEVQAVEVGDDGAKLLTLGVGKVDKDPVLQAGKAQIDRVKAASEEIIFEILDIRGGLVGRRVEAARLGFVQKVIDQMDELAAGFCDFGDHAGRERVKSKRKRDCNSAWPFGPGTFPLYLFP